MPLSFDVFDVQRLLLSIIIIIYEQDMELVYRLAKIKVVASADLLLLCEGRPFEMDA